MTRTHEVPFALVHPLISESSRKHGRLPRLLEGLKDLKGLAQPRDQLPSYWGGPAAKLFRLPHEPDQSTHRMRGACHSSKMRMPPGPRDPFELEGQELQELQAQRHPQPSPICAGGKSSSIRKSAISPEIS